MKTTLLLFLTMAAIFTHAAAPDSKVAAGAVNALGVDLYHAQTRGEDNLLLSPYSIQNALAMTYAGAAGDTHAEMQRVLHFPADDNALHESFGALAQQLVQAAKKSEESVTRSKKFGGPATPIEFNLANRLFAEKDCEFRAPFLDLVKRRYDAPLEKVDYKSDPEKVRTEINHWVEQQTKNKIRDLVPPRAITPLTRLTLVNALYLRAPWEKEFVANATKPERFLVHGRDGVDVPTMIGMTSSRYAKRDGMQIVTRAYWGGELQFVILLPESPGGLSGVERALSAKLLEECAQLPAQDVILHLPKFRIEPPTMMLGANLKALGMKTAFDVPAGSANFDGIAPRRPNDYLFIGEVAHKTFIALDEKGTEAAAATAVMMPAGAAMIPKPKPVEVRVDHPFLFAIQHVPSGACLFLGRVTDPR